MDQRSVVPFAVYLVGLRGQYLVRRITLVRVWSACLSRRLVHILCKLGLSSGPRGGRPRARLKAGTPCEARTPAPTTSHRPHNSYPTPYEGRKNVESTNLQNYRRRAPTFKTIGVEGRAEPPTEPRVNTEIRRPTQAGELEPKHATGCNSMQDRPASKTPPVGLHPTAQVRHVHSVKKRRPPQQQQLVPPATRRDTTGGACHTHTSV